MTFRPRFGLLFVLVASACAAVTASSYALSQSSAVPQQQANEKTGFGDNPEDRRMAYSSLIILISGEESLIERDMQEGRTPRSRASFKFLGIREDEEQAMRALLVNAKHQIEENDRQCTEARLELDQNHSEELKAKVEALKRHRPEIVDETVVKLRQELGVEDFKKLDAWVYRIYEYHPKLPQASPAKDQDSEQPGSSLATPAMAVHA